MNELSNEVTHETAIAVGDTSQTVRSQCYGQCRKYFGVERGEKQRKHPRYKAKITHKGQHIHIGCFTTAEEAAFAYDCEARKLRPDKVVNFVSVEEGEKACAEAIQRYENSLLLQLTGAQRSLQESTGADRVQVQRKLSAGAVLHQVHHSRKPRSKSGFFGVSGVAVKTSAAK